MRISVISHFYGNFNAVKRVIESYKYIESRYHDKFEFILVDDHSEKIPETSLFESLTNLRVFRISEDIPWNQAGSRNIGALESTGDIILFHDIDHIIPESSLEGTITAASEIKKSERIFFSRRKILSDGSIKEHNSHLNSFLISKKDFFRIGGYDEIFSGSYGEEDKFLQLCCRRQGFSERIIESYLEVVENFSTRSLNRSKSRNSAIMNYYIASGQYRANVSFILGYNQIYPKIE